MLGSISEKAMEKASKISEWYDRSPYSPKNAKNWTRLANYHTGIAPQSCEQSAIEGVENIEAVCQPSSPEKDYACEDAVFAAKVHNHAVAYQMGGAFGYGFTAMLTQSPFYLASIGGLTAVTTGVEAGEYVYDAKQMKDQRQIRTALVEGLNAQQ